MAGIGDIGKKAGVKYDDVAKTIEGIRQLLIEGNKITLQDFGTFELGVQDSRNARNPYTGEAIVTEPKMVPKFSFNDSFKKKVAASVQLNEDMLNKKRSDKQKYFDKQAEKEGSKEAAAKPTAKESGKKSKK